MPTRKTKVVAEDTVSDAEETGPKFQEAVALKALQYYAVNEKVKEMTKEATSLKTDLKKDVHKFGTELPSGSKAIQIDYADKRITLNESFRPLAKTVPEAMDILRDAGITDCITTETFLRDDILEEMVKAGKVPDEVMKKLYVVKPSYAFTVKVEPLGSVSAGDILE